MKLEWLFATQKNRICLGLESMAFLLEKLGHPEKQLRVLHVAGTNGKGSVSAFAESLLRAEGYSTGLYTSPHLLELHERIRINGKNITQSRLEERIERLQWAIRDWEQQPTFFELMTALAFDVFARAKLDVVILETGLGGRLDATNLTAKLACAITPISLDHMEYLGPTLAHIAREKAGIMRQGIPVISAPQAAEARAALIAEADKMEAPLQFITEPLSADVNSTFAIGNNDFLQYTRPQDVFSNHLGMLLAARKAAGETAEGSPEGKTQRELSESIYTPHAFKNHLKTKSLQKLITSNCESRVELGLAGSHQRWNAALALALVKSGGFKISPEAQKKGFASVSWPGRFQKILLDDADGITRTIVLDGAHNPAAAEQLAQTWREEFPGQPCTLVFGSLADKEGAIMLQRLEAIAEEIFLVPIDSPRTASPEELLPLFPTVKTFSSLAEVFKQLFFDKKDSSFHSKEKHNRPILLTGSLFLVGEALALLQGKEYRPSMQ